MRLVLGFRANAYSVHPVSSTAATTSSMRRGRCVRHNSADRARAQIINALGRGMAASYSVSWGGEEATFRGTLTPRFKLPSKEATLGWK
jgi:hypothetical protein